MLTDLPVPALRLDLDGDALAANWRMLDRWSGAARAGAAVKADAYGVGAHRVVPLLREAGCRDFFVAHWLEAAALVDLLDPRELAVLHGPLSDADCRFARESGVRPVINSLEQARRWLAQGGGWCDLMVDTGMNRLGVAMTDLADETLRGLQVDVLHSHLVASEDEAGPNEQQRRRWREACAIVPHQRAALANSGGIALGPDFHGDLTRPGLALYGGHPNAAFDGKIRQVVVPRAAVLQVRRIAAGETVGYNATFTAPRAMRVGTIAIGYADGYLRCWSSRGVFRNSEKPLPVLGRVSMDMVVIDLDAAPDLAEGDWVSADYALPEAAQTSGLSQYELLTGLGRRFQR
ncbi:alanine racemase [Novosphingobium colocasiae]|uniref:alanine racemase n=1 Tax=Novosphingobium colocasiae TaxID=1256513 RepID=A0A918UDJ3_9SPHN|nr:alanine racemase [Novosphingobium colocasiae]GGY96969.1 alanine racemase, catabolic [Novosphingobium colocasiae]